jgi:glycerophosphoryl diester phosphodiesterase
LQKFLEVMEKLKDFVENRRVFIAAHRGASGVAPENTIAAYEEAMKGGADMIEVDVQMSVDRKIICYHDSRLGRTAIGKKPISKLPLKYLRKLDVGSWFDRYYQSQRIPTLDETIELIRDKAYLNIEIKSSKEENNKEKAIRIYEIVKEKGYIPYTLFASFDMPLISEMKQNDPDIHIAGIKIPGNDTPASELKEKYGIEAFIVSIDELSQEIDDDCKKNGIYLAVYSVDNWYELEKIKKYNVKTVVSNYPGTISGIINRYFPLAI